jgi:hypothetical protein
MREDRLVFPIPPGLHWRDEMPVMERGAGRGVQGPQRRQATVWQPRRGSQPQVGAKAVRGSARAAQRGPAVRPLVGGAIVEETPKPAPAVRETRREKRPPVKIDPTLVRQGARAARSVPGTA